MKPWKEKIALLEAKGLTLGEIGSRIGLSAGAIGDLKSGRTTEPRYEAGRKLIELYNGIVYGNQAEKAA